MMVEVLGIKVRSLRMFEEFWASRCALSRCLRSFGRHGALSHDVKGVLGVTARSRGALSHDVVGVLGVTVRSLMICLRSFGRHGAHDVRSFGRHGALSYHVGEVFGVTVRSLVMFEEFWASRCALS